MTKVFLLLLLAAIAAGVFEAKGAIEARETVNGDNNLEYDIESQENEQHSNMYLAKPREQSNGTGGDFDEISEAIERLDLQAENTP
ncbi:uncharacterized protein LOC119167618 isoform X3 [Rhipicephalus microplus]|uniref:uncharacterized protein LOC119167618 isoform X3 n=1 Tax=Rhipicephalus microplus TaxID=6941 RepID=UPI0018897C86|nr:uncharacterized protein LOC119167618 isoform X3 [Rhipicephalus microplus]